MRPAVPPLLETPRLVLGPHRAEDFEAFHAMWADPAVFRHITGAAATRQEAWMRLLRNAGLWPLLGYGAWAVHEKRSGRYVGSIGFADFHRELVPSIDGVPEAGWVLAPWAHGRGFAGEALARALAWLDRTAFTRSVCLIDPANLASLRLAAKHGFGDARTVRFHDADTNLLSRRRPSQEQD